MKEKSAGERIYKIFIYVVLVALAVCILVPVAWVFMASIKQNSEFYGNPWSLPLGFHWQNFVDAWNTAKMGDYMLTSVIVTVLALGILLVVNPFHAAQLVIMIFGAALVADGISDLITALMSRKAPSTP